MPNGAARANDTPRLASPIACPAGVGCVIRNFVDVDPGNSAKDWRCGPLTYDGHKGTDIRIADGAAMAKGVPVLAAAAGTVLRLRDGADDVSIRVIGLDAVKNREAGNAVVIDHGGGWQTQYSHLRKGSVIVKGGQQVTAGQQLGIMGLSGMTEYTHVHLDVRRNGKIIDPFTAAEPGTGCGTPGTSLWTAAAAASLVYREDAPMDAGFADGSPEKWPARAGAYAEIAASRASPELIFWVDVLGHRKGDRETIQVIAPDGSLLARSESLVTETHIANFRFAGKKRPATGWPAGKYRGAYSLSRKIDGMHKPIIEIERAIELR